MKNADISGNEKSFFLLTLDVEEDMPLWVPENPITVRNIFGLKRFQELCREFGIKPTYLVTYPVAALDESVKILRELLSYSSCEIGAHLHPWNTPPLGPGEGSEAYFLSRLPYHSVKAKLGGLTAAIVGNLGVTPISFRSGRFGLTQDVLEALKELNYAVDSSVTPCYNWSKEGGPDFTRFSTDPFHVDLGGRRLIEVPVTIAFNREISLFWRNLYHRFPKSLKLQAVLDRLNILKLTWLRPTLAGFYEMKNLIKTLLKRNVRVFNMMIHSSELWPGTSPYFKNESDVDGLFSRMREIFSFIMKEMRFESATLGEMKDFSFKKGTL